MALFDAIASRYDEWYTTPMGSLVDSLQKELLLELANPVPFERALDIGTGTGNYALELARTGLSVTGLDISAAMLELAKAKAKSEGLALAFRQGDAHTLPFADGTFDLVIAATAFEFMQDPARVIAEALRVLRSGGRLVVGVLGRESAWEELYRERAARDPGSVFAGARFYTAAELAGLGGGAHARVAGALYLAPNDFQLLPPDRWLAEERRLAADGSREPGFVAARWEK